MADYLQGVWGMTDYQKIMIQKARELEDNAIQLTDNIHESYSTHGKIQAQDVARVEKLYRQAVSIREAVERCEG